MSAVYYINKAYIQWCEKNQRALMATENMMILGGLKKVIWEMESQPLILLLILQKANRAALLRRSLAPHASRYPLEKEVKDHKAS